MWGSRSSSSSSSGRSSGSGASARAPPTLRYEDEDALFLRLQREQEAAKYLWFDSFVRPEEVLEASEHRPKYEMSVTGKKRIKPGSRTVTIGTKVEINGKDVAIFKNNGEFFAIDDTCPHQGASLHLGDIEEIDGMVCVSCPRHHWPFSLEDGSCIIPVKIKAQWHPVQVRTCRLMGIKQSKTNTSQSAPAPEPLALVKTSTGVIVRIPDPTTGASTFHHNPRFVAPLTVSDILHNGESQSLPVGEGNQVMVARAGIKNDALKGKIVYVTKPPRQLAARSTTGS
uniref:Rieske domain-containing protein n=1 Tax=Globisporangium ultimum (strain ATCC 200006 / CBS 805.95 / DAOM BR144) TaxID=431595 RepID=K3WKD0_GLOUD